LHHSVVFARSLHHLAAFLDCERDRLLDIDVLARLACPDCLQRVPVIRRSNRDRVDILAIEQLSNIYLGCRTVAPELLDLRDRVREQSLVDVTKSDDPRVWQPRKSADMCHPAATEAD